MINSLKKKLLRPVKIRIAEEAKYLDFEKLLKYRDSAARVTCEFFIKGQFRTAFSFVVDFYIYDSELHRRVGKFSKED